jgi:hypothetical protein
VIVTEPAIELRIPKHRISDSAKVRDHLADEIYEMIVKELELCHQGRKSTNIQLTNSIQNVDK